MSGRFWRTVLFIYVALLAYIAWTQLVHAHTGTLDVPNLPGLNSSGRFPKTRIGPEPLSGLWPRQTPESPTRQQHTEHFEQPKKANQRAAP
jgi:hypothetical protein